LGQREGRAAKTTTDRIAMLETQIVVLDVKLHVREDELSRTHKDCDGRGCANQSVSFTHHIEQKRATATHLFSDLPPYNPRHLVAVQFDDWMLHDDLLS